MKIRRRLRTKICMIMNWGIIHLGMVTFREGPDFDSMPGYRLS